MGRMSRLKSTGFEAFDAWAMVAVCQAMTASARDSRTRGAQGDCVFKNSSARLGICRARVSQWQVASTVPLCYEQVFRLSSLELEPWSLNQDLFGTPFNL